MARDTDRVPHAQSGPGSTIRDANAANPCHELPVPPPGGGPAIYGGHKKIGIGASARTISEAVDEVVTTQIKTVADAGVTDLLSSIYGSAEEREWTRALLVALAATSG